MTGNRHACTVTPSPIDTGAGEKQMHTAYRRLLALLVLSAGAWGLLTDEQKVYLIAVWMLVAGFACLLYILHFCGVKV